MKEDMDEAMKHLKIMVRNLDTHLRDEAHRLNTNVDVLCPCFDELVKAEDFIERIEGRVSGKRRESMSQIIITGRKVVQKGKRQNRKPISEISRFNNAVKKVYDHYGL
jgi:hypothetical protein